MFRALVYQCFEAYKCGGNVSGSVMACDEKAESLA